MAARKAFACVQAVFGLLGVVAIIVTYSIVTGWNPLPGWGNWLANATVRSLSKPATTWVKRAGNEPVAAVVVGSYVVVSTDGSVEVHSLATGEKLWEQSDSWALTAGDSHPVVVVGKVVGNGFDVYDMSSGVRMWGSNNKYGVWAYSNALLLLRCSHGSKCVLRDLDPVNGGEIWHAAIGGAGGSPSGAGRRLAMTAALDSEHAGTISATPAPAPDLIGLPMSGEMRVIKTSNGMQLTSFPVNARTRSVVTGDTVLTTTATFASGQCSLAISGRDPATGATRWSKSGYDTKTSGGLACDERHDPVGGGGAVYAIDSAGRDALLSASAGRVLYTAKKGEKIVATDGRIAVIRGADRKELRAVDLSTGNTAWTRPADGSAQVGIVPGAVLIADPATEKLVALDRSRALAFFDVASGATVLGVGANQVIINIGRSFGPLPMSGGP